VSGHGEGGGAGVASDQRLDDGQVLAGLLGQAAVVVAGLMLGVRHIAEGAEKDLQTSQFLGQEGVAARSGDQVVQPAIDDAGVVDELGDVLGRAGAEAAEVVGDGVQLG
jgi:hypothetical protein